MAEYAARELTEKDFLQETEEFVQPMQPTRFVNFTEDDLDSIELLKDEKATTKQTTWGVKLLRDWLIEKNENPAFEYLSPEGLAVILRRFYAEARSKTGERYSKSSLTGIRASVNRHLNSPPYHRNVNIIRDREFKAANNIFVALCKQLKADGLDSTKHKTPISTYDLRKLASSGVLSSSDPLALSRKVWFDLTFHFGRRGREGFRKLTKSSYRVRESYDGTKFVEFTYSEKTKNHPDDDFETQAKMFATGGENCPVAAFAKYLSKLNPGENALFQRPRVNVKPDDKVWYCNSPLGENKLGSMMKDISKAANLSTTYTNHCVRATA
ncbi:uncharacterized protein [Ptychodera flava]|uniref:uncharacterized protein n=1 Tax=Ptychodera flava TaxID=63121 RepID=UPI003969ED5B